MRMMWACYSMSGCTCGVTKATATVIYCCRPLKTNCRCDCNTCKHAHVSDCAGQLKCMMECSACITRRIPCSNCSFDSANSNSDHRSELE